MLPNIKLKNSYLDLIKIFSSLPKKRLISFNFLIALTVFSSFLEFLSLGSVIPFIAIITDSNKLNNLEFLNSIFNLFGIYDDFGKSKIITITFVSIILITFIFRMYLTFFTVRLSEIITGDLEKKIYSNSINMDYELHKSYSSSIIISTITQKLFEFSQLLFSILQAFSAIFIGLVLITSILIFSFQISILVLIFFSIIFTFIILVSKSILKKHSRIITDTQKTLLRKLQDTYGSLKNIKINNNSNIFIEEYDFELSKKINSVSINNFISRYPRFLIETLAIIFIALISFYLFVMLKNSFEVYLTDFVVVAIASIRLLPLLNQIYFSWSTLEGYSSGLKSIISLIEIEMSHEKLSKEKIKFDYSICLENITYTYPNSSLKLFNNINVKIKKNTNTLIFGKSGSGKSTLMEIMMGLIKPSSGRLLIDNLELNKNNLPSYHRIISFVSQNTYLLQDSLKKNIAFGLKEEEIDFEKLKNSSLNAEIYKFIQSKKNNFDFILSESAKNISGGQKQRIALARALYENFDILFLDEPTAGLDNETEEKIIDDILNFKNIGKTCIVIMHNKKYFDKFDNLINIDNYL